MYMKQGLSFWLLPSSTSRSFKLGLRTSWVDSERVIECLEYRRESNELSPSYILLVSCLLQHCSEVKHDLASISVHLRTICYFDTPGINYDFFVHVLMMVYAERVQKQVEKKDLGLSEEFWAEATGIHLTDQACHCVKARANVVHPDLSWAQKIVIDP
ncbi:hypothetical protein DFH08DRAFT_825183 [Mycena albidolilacea]|uniref:Uncharacterized protein n=1 Tax=Mycena albidolilacea TaxID=1033008 RepID=A0AAD6Z2V2_9AGAR|nr:hypothetical protein DFH08DRAFT_825183 [Mycena albidolilacea]